MNHTVLLVDDESSVRKAVARLLRPLGYEIIEASSGAMALELLKTKSVSLVIADMRMPGMDGAELLKHISQGYTTTMSRILHVHAATLLHFPNKYNKTHNHVRL